MARTVLLADDSVTAQNMGRRILMDAGYEVITVNNGSAALKKIHESRPDLIVLDVYMPGYGGLEVCQRLKESGDTMRIPILLSVGKMEPFKADEAKRVRADGHIVKPFEASELLAALTRLEDRIVPQPEPSRGRKEKSEKKPRSWHVPSDPAQVPEEWSDKIAHLASTKERLVHRDAEPESEPQTLPATLPPESPKAEPSRPAAEMPVVAATEPEMEQQEVAASEFAAAEQSAPVEVIGAAAQQSEESQSFTEDRAPAANSALSESQPISQEAAPELLPESPVAAEPHSQQPSAESVTIVSEALQAAIAEVGALNGSNGRPRWVAENVAVTAEEAALELDLEMKQAQTPPVPPAETALAEASTPSPAIAAGAEFRSAQPEDAVDPEERKGATFAAAASASSSAIATASQEPASDDESTPAGPDAAAAWQNWQQIRDSVMTPQTASALAESVAEVAKAVAPPLSTQASETATDSSSISSLENEVLASIVDSVLAELKPRLMQEIAKKLKK